MKSKSIQGQIDRCNKITTKYWKLWERNYLKQRKDWHIINKYWRIYTKWSNKCL